MTRLRHKPTFGEKLGTRRCAASLLLYGSGLNSGSGICRALSVKPLLNLVEATITLATGGSL
ncbi:MAG: hypothetical protein M3Z24_04360 [Chloroflexota bacterium]|nr:hypothetical protein [Chloroflexota bacterium]